MREMGNAYEVLSGKPEGKRQLERPGRRRDDSMKLTLRK
jgi:hypothetical protein